MSPVQLPRQLKTLDDLLAQAEHYANYSMRNRGTLCACREAGAESAVSSPRQCPALRLRLASIPELTDL
jgi:hypothetical protein